MRAPTLFASKTRSLHLPASRPNATVLPPGRDRSAVLRVFTRPRPGTDAQMRHSSDVQSSLTPRYRPFESRRPDQRQWVDLRIRVAAAAAARSWSCSVRQPATQNTSARTRAGRGAASAALHATAGSDIRRRRSSSGDHQSNNRS